MHHYARDFVYLGEGSTEPERAYLGESRGEGFGLGSVESPDAAVEEEEPLAGRWEGREGEPRMRSTVAGLFMGEARGLVTDDDRTAVC